MIIDKTNKQHSFVFENKNGASTVDGFSFIYKT